MTPRSRCAISQSHPTPSNPATVINPALTVRDLYTHALSVNLQSGKRGKAKSKKENNPIQSPQMSPTHTIPSLPPR